MSFGWERVGGYASVLAAEQWCDRAGIARNDRDIRDTADGVELLVRATAMDDKESEPRKNGFW